MFTLELIRHSNTIDWWFFESNKVILLERGPQMQFIVVKNVSLIKIPTLDGNRKCKRDNTTHVAK